MFINSPLNANTNLETVILSTSIFFSVDTFFSFIRAIFCKKDWLLFLFIPNLSKQDAPGRNVESRGGLL